LRITKGFFLASQAGKIDLSWSFQLADRVYVMAFNPVLVVTRATKPDWYKLTEPYARSRTMSSVGQLINSLIPYLLCMAFMAYCVLQEYPYLFTLLLAIVAAGFYVRIFILFHDCTHGALFNSPRWNRNIGYLCGVLVFTAFHDWRRTHAAHHIRAGDLDRRGFGDIWTLTLEEFRTAPLLIRLAYRLYRNPLVLFILGPSYYFLVGNRWPSKGARKRDILSVVYTNLALIFIIVTASLSVGLETYLLVQLPVIVIAGAAGIWLFYVQHQFKGVYWAHTTDWEPLKVAMQGASFYQLPKLLQWFTGNIGYHHLHHVRPAIPNYMLQSCHEAIPALQAVKPLTLRASLACIGLKLYDEEHQELVGFNAHQPQSLKNQHT
jgi:omega-6 fatty acid desaturase (delta-12 desaturase)